MSHFYVMAIVPQGSDYEEKIAALMAKYDEGRDVPEYEKPCYCIGRKAKHAAREEADREVGSVDSLRESFHKVCPLPQGKTGFDLDAEQDEARRIAWRKHLAPYEEAEKRALDQRADRNAPNPECEECKGTGKERSTYNPDSRWDWYVIGGRWDGEIQAKERDDGRGNYGDDHHQLQYNSLPVRDVLASWKPDSAPFAILTPDGQWHEKAEMGWWGMTRNEKPVKDWRVEAKAILADYADGYVAVGLDCHI